jgi:hypothetical protein
LGCGLDVVLALFICYIQAFTRSLNNKENIATAHTKCSSAHKKNKNNFLLTNTQKKFFKAKGLIFLFAP